MAESLIDSGFGWVGQIPSTWVVNKNKYVFINSKNLVGKNWESTQLLSLTKNGVKEKDINEGGGKQPDSFSTYQYVKKSDLVMCLFDLDQSAVFSGISKYDGMISPAYKLLKCNEEINPEYASYWFDFVFDGRKFKTYSKNIRYTLDYDEFGKLPILTPPLEEQKRIADFLDEKCAEINKLSEDIQRQINILENDKKSMAYKILTNGSFNSSLINTGDDVWKTIPKGWKLVDIKYLFEIVKRIAGKEGYDVLSVTQKGLKVKDITSGDGQLADDYSKYQLVFPSDYVMNHMDLLTGWVDLSDKTGVTSPDYRVFRLRDKHNNSLEYFKYVMQCCYMNKIFYSLGQGVSNLGRWRLQTSAFNNFKIPVPPLSEQQAIADKLTVVFHNMDKAINLKNNQLQKLDDYKKSIIYEYVTGKKRVA